MSKSQRLRLRDLRNIYRLIGECRDLGHDPQAWRTHLLSELGRLVGGTVAVGGEFHGASLETIRLLYPIDLGWDIGSQERELWHKHIAEEGSGKDCLFEAFYERLQQGRGPLTCLRQELLDDRAWYGSPHYNLFRKPSRVDSCIYSVYPTVVGGRQVFDGISFHRPPGDRPLGQREQRMVHWLHHELGPLIGRQLASPSEPALSGLSPRLREVLECLVAGDSEKQIAWRLKISRATVHEYISELYRRFDVHSRGELLASFHRFDRSARLAGPGEAKSG